MGIKDINNVQSLILSNIGDEELTIGELTNRGYYLGSNVSYNVKKLVENGYLEQERSPHDRRAMRVSLSSKGKVLCARINELYQRNAEDLSKAGLREEDLGTANQTLRVLERYWTEYMGFGRF